MKLLQGGRKWLICLGLLVLAVYLVKVETSAKSSADSFQQSSQFQAGEFANSPAISKPELLPILKKYWRADAPDNSPQSAVPIKALSALQIAALPADQLSIVRFGHSTLLLKIANQLWLIDPVFSKRVSPFSFMGPKRFHQPPISISDLPRLDGVIISHDHYDHLDRKSIKQLKDKVAVFLVPLGIKAKLEKWGVGQEHIRELDWWQSITLGDVEIVSTPAQHFSGRGVFDRNSTLWSSWVIKAKQHRVFYSGDSGYFDGFKEIGQKYGPFDLAMLEVGAYDTLWPSVHMFPEQALQANSDLDSRLLLPVHNGTFDLAFHAWYEPLETMYQLCLQSDSKVLLPMVGEPISISGLEGNDSSDKAEPQKVWWRGLN
jgi:L-ascorbate metabolism protein UlaG (beta-lactamase superfamily)